MNDLPSQPAEPRRHKPDAHRTAEHRRRRLRRHGRRAFVRSVYFLPTLATLGNAVCGFAAIYIAGLDEGNVGPDPLTKMFFEHRFFAAAYLIFMAMVFDALDGRLARWARHTTDFGGQLDSLADVISFGVAPAFIALQLFKSEYSQLPHVVTRLVWAAGAIYMSCAAMRLARFNVSNEHGEQHHMSFLGLPSPGAGGAIAAMILVQQDLKQPVAHIPAQTWQYLTGLTSKSLTVALPCMLLLTGILMVSNIRYAHLINRYLRGRKSIMVVILMVTIVMLVVVAHRYMLAIACVGYALGGLISYLIFRLRPRAAVTPPPPSVPKMP